MNSCGERLGKDLLSAAGLRDARPHDPRYTAATILLPFDVPTRVVMVVMGWPERDMLLRYQHVIGKIRKDVTDRLEALLWTPFS